MQHVPVLDIHRYDNDRDAFVAELGAAYREFGFCGITGHGIDPKLIDGAYDVFQGFFALPLETKMKYHVPGTGGARKVRFAGRGKGKSGGYRVITFYSGSEVPVFLITLFAKGEKVDLTQAERNAMKRELAGLVEDYRRGARRHVRSR